jgi:hypothetical protein
VLDPTEVKPTVPNPEIRRQQLLVLRPAEAHIRVVIEFESKKIGTRLQGESNDCVY